MKPISNNLEYLMRCPICDHRYNHSKVLVLDEEKNKTTFYITCDDCQIATIVLVSTNNFGVVSLGILTDLNREEAQRLYKNEVISSDQVIEMHQFLKDFKGEIKEII